MKLLDKFVNYRIFSYRGLIGNKRHTILFPSQWFATDGSVLVLADGSSSVIIEIGIRSSPWTSYVMIRLHRIYMTWSIRRLRFTAGRRLGFPFDINTDVSLSLGAWSIRSVEPMFVLTRACMYWNMVYGTIDNGGIYLRWSGDRMSTQTGASAVFGCCF